MKTQLEDATEPVTEAQQAEFRAQTMRFLKERHASSHAAVAAKKLERIAQNAAVTVAPCTESGEVTGQTLPAVARILPDDDPCIEAADASLEARYPQERPAMTQLLADNGWRGIFIEISPPPTD